MEKKSRTSRELFQSVVGDIKIDYTQDIKEDEVRVFATITKDGKTLGSLGYNSVRGNLSIGIMGYDTMSVKEKDAVLKKICDDIKSLRK